MLPTLTRHPFDSANHLFEVKWDGVRILAWCDSSSTRLFSRTLRDVTHQFPEYGDLHKRLRVSNAVLDGEVVAMDEKARPSFGLLQKRINLSRPADIARAVDRVPLDLVLFDLPFAAGSWLGGHPLTDRIARLAEAAAFGERVMRSEPIAEHGIALFEAARARGLEGVVGKSGRSHYLPGRRTREWLKVKAVYDADCVIGGYTAGANSRSASLGALLVGMYGPEGRLSYLGSVGTGFTQQELGRLRAELELRRRNRSPFADGPDGGAELTWVEPELVCRVEFRELTAGRRLRAPSYQGLRDDKRPQDCLLDQLDS